MQVQWSETISLTVQIGKSQKDPIKKIESTLLVQAVERKKAGGRQVRIVSPEFNRVRGVAGRASLAICLSRYNDLLTNGNIFKYALECLRPEGERVCKQLYCVAYFVCPLQGGSDCK